MMTVRGDCFTASFNFSWEGKYGNYILDSLDRLNSMITATVGRRITYQDLIA
jgi:hypothetical protein